MVERNRVGSSIIFSILTAFLSPSSALAFTFFSFREMTAISVAAKKAFNRISISCKSNCRTISDINQASKIIQNAFDDCEWYQFKTAIKRRSLSKTHLPHLKGFCAAIHVLLRGSGSTKPSPFHFKNYIITKISFCQDETVCFYGCTVALQ